MGLSFPLVPGLILAVHIQCHVEDVQTLRFLCKFRLLGEGALDFFFRLLCLLKQIFQFLPVLPQILPDTIQQVVQAGDVAKGVAARFHGMGALML